MVTPPPKEERPMFFGPRVQHATIDELRQAVSNGSHLVIDVREPNEYASGHVPSAINMPVGSLPQAAAALDRDAQILVICQSGHRSVTASKRLMKAGFTQVRNVTGGTSSWRGPLQR
jgi:rhodanese-related sulfurtransferase